MAGSGRMGTDVKLRMGLSLTILAFLLLNLWYRVATIFDYSRVVSGVFVCLAVCSLVVIVFPRLLKGFLFAFGASFFLFGFRGYDIQSQVFETVVVFVALTALLVNTRGARSTEQGARSSQDSSHLLDGRSHLNRQLLVLILCYVGLSVLSLMLLPVGHIVKDFWLFGWKSFFLQVANAMPNSWLYPLAGMNRLLVFLVFAVEVAKARESRELFRWIFIGIFVGGVFCAFIGLLDYYGVVSLKWYRLGTTVSPGALHSTFLNRSWLAEFILMMAPFVLIGFMSRIKGLWWKFLLLASLVLCEVALLLGGARGGWVSYPLILFVCWLFFYFTKEGRLESFHFKWRDLVKVAVSVPITIVISLLLIFYVIMPLSNYVKEDAGAKGSKARPKHSTAYIERQASRIVEPSGRLKAWTQGLDVGREQPWFGMGYEAFCWHANILSKVPDSYYVVNKDNKHNRVLDTPHNIYFQLFASGGIVGLFFWALVIGYALTILVVDLIRNKRLLNVPVIISIISFHTYGLFQSMQYIPMIWMFIFLALGYALTIDERVLPDSVRRASGWVIKGMVVLVLIGGVVYFVGRGSQDLADRYGLKVYAEDQDWHNYLGFYHREKGPAGHFRFQEKGG
ncbi:MAG: O-antigen ligase family protein [Deltaproteobacteria bacterium]|nr:O-antigen ligase family protein [Deltaproteobacteria bacterium]